MKCPKCDFENKEKAKFCTKCGNSLVKPDVQPSNGNSDNSRYLIVGLLIVIIILCAIIGYFVLGMDSGSLTGGDDSQSQDSNESEVTGSSNEDDDSDVQTTTVSSTQVSTSSESESETWESIGSYSGSGTGSQTISVPPGKIMIKLSAFPIKNYATNYLYVTGSNDKSGGVEWGPKSAVESRSDSFTYESSSEETFTIDYYETVSWEVEFFISR